MSELKATTAQEIVRNEKDCDYMDELFGGVKMPPTQVYLKSEADAFIADLEESNKKEVEQLLIEIVELKADYKEACDRLQTANLIKDEQLAATRHNKYKRCLAMARWCERKRIDAANYRIPRQKWDFYDKWHKRWLELAEKFKPKGGEVMCEYCENGKPLIGDEQDGSCIENGNILVSYGECTDFAKGRINFCPKCGRKLAEDK